MGISLPYFYRLCADCNYTGYLWRAYQQSSLDFGEGRSFYNQNSGVHLFMYVRLWRNRRLFASCCQKSFDVLWSSLVGAHRPGLFHCGWLYRRKTQPTGLVAAFLLLVCSTGHAFEQSGHQMVAQLMIPYLNQPARDELQRLFGEDWQALVVRRAGQTQAEMSRPKNSGLAALQFTLFNMGDEGFDPAMHCKNNACSVGAVLESEQVLLKSSFDDSDKRDAFWFLMHYNLQLHIPMNCGLVRDEGGRKIYVDDDNLKPVNLSYIWNYDLYRKLNKSWFSYAKALYREMEQDDFDKSGWVESKRPQDWAYESHQLAINEAYPLAGDGRYSADMIGKGQALLETQLMKAAYRTAVLLNELFPEEMMKGDS